MAIEGYCVRCRKNQIMQNIKFTKTSKGVNMAKGKCPICGTNMARIGVKPQTLPEGVIIHKPTQITPTISPQQEISPQPIPNYPPNQDLTEINKQIANLQHQKAEKERVLRYMEEVKKNPVLNSHGIGIFNNNEQKVVKRSIYMLLKILLVLFGIAIIVLFFMGYQGYFKSNNTCNPTNVVECKEQICNVTSLCEGTICESQICNVTNICNFPSVINVIVNNTNNTI